jgi:competence protein CoiA
MKYALVDGGRQEAQPDLSGQCPSCGRLMVAKCGEVRIRHWAHLGRRMCDVWWENETEWHRAWKGQFPSEWQEIVHCAENGEKHIADVKTDQGWVLEFQHSFLNPEERRARDSFYQHLIWIVDGTRRRRDISQFSNAFKLRSPVGNGNVIWRVPADGCGLLREWAECRAPVFFDFGNANGLWWLLPKHADGVAHVAKFTHGNFLALHQSGSKEKIDEFAKLLQEFRSLIANYYAPQVQPAPGQQTSTSPQPQGFPRYLMARPRRRRL